MSYLTRAFAEALKDNPDAGKVSNADPAKEFAFEVEGGFTVADVMNMQEGEPEEKLHAVDDYGLSIETVPLDSTSRSFSFHFLDRLIKLPYPAPTIKPSLLVQCMAGIIALKIIPNHQAFGFDSPPEELLKYPFYRFYYCAGEGYWTVTFATRDIVQETAR